jgi:hypothetical protein
MITKDYQDFALNFLRVLDVVNTIFKVVQWVALTVKYEWWPLH